MEGRIILLDFKVSLLWGKIKRYATRIGVRLFWYRKPRAKGKRGKGSHRGRVGVGIPMATTKTNG